VVEGEKKEENARREIPCEKRMMRMKKEREKEGKEERKGREARLKKAAT
jgi:hypothetical protein